MIRDAILREIGRGGQVFFLLTASARLNSAASSFKACRRRIAIAHGQMRHKRWKNVMLDFSQQKFDVLLCTTIIESGLDIPMANTRLSTTRITGLGQLYQMRGRVGRSNQAGLRLFTVRWARCSRNWA